MPWLIASAILRWLMETETAVDDWNHSLVESASLAAKWTSRPTSTTTTFSTISTISTRPDILAPVATCVPTKSLLAVTTAQKAPQVPLPAVKSTQMRSLTIIAFSVIVVLASFTAIFFSKTEIDSVVGEDDFVDEGVESLSSDSSRSNGGDEPDSRHSQTRLQPAKMPLGVLQPSNPNLNNLQPPSKDKDLHLLLNMVLHEPVLPFTIFNPLSSSKISLGETSRIQSRQISWNTINSANVEISDQENMEPDQVEIPALYEKIQSPEYVRMNAKREDPIKRKGASKVEEKKDIEGLFAPKDAPSKRPASPYPNGGCKKDAIVNPLALNLTSEEADEVLFSITRQAETFVDFESTKLLALEEIYSSSALAVSKLRYIVSYDYIGPDSGVVLVVDIYREVLVLSFTDLLNLTRTSCSRQKILLLLDVVVHSSTELAEKQFYSFIDVLFLVTYPYLKEFVAEVFQKAMCSVHTSSIAGTFQHIFEERRFKGQRADIALECFKVYICANWADLVEELVAHPNENKLSSVSGQLLEQFKKTAFRYLGENRGGNGASSAKVAEVYGVLVERYVQNGAIPAAVRCELLERFLKGVFDILMPFAICEGVPLMEPILPEFEGELAVE